MCHQTRNDLGRNCGEPGKNAPNIARAILSRSKLPFNALLAFVLAIATLAADQAVAKDMQRPRVKIWSPTSGSTVSGIVSVGAVANDNVGVARVDLLMNGAKVASVATAPYTFSWDSTTASNGSVELAIVAYDTSGNAASAKQSVTVANTKGTDTQPPTIGITAPLAGSVVSGAVSISASVTDNVGIARVDLLINGGRVASDATAPYTFSWDSTTASNGSVELAIVAYDTSGNAASAKQSVTVANTKGTDTQPPTIGITAPLAGSVVSGAVSISASVTDNVGIARVDLLINGGRSRAMRRPPTRSAGIRRRSPTDRSNSPSWPMTPVATWDRQCNPSPCPTRSRTRCSRRSASPLPLPGVR